MCIASFILALMMCVITEQTYIFDKSGQGITDMTVYTIHWNTTEIKFNSNSLTHIKAGNLHDLANLVRINLRYNKISDIDPFSFSAVPSVREIDLWSNRLTVIGQFMFAGLPLLKKLWFWRNDIHTIEPGCFHDNTELRFLQLGWNDLKTLPESMFNMKNHRAELNPLSIEGNPLMCDVSVCWVRKGEENGWITLSWAWETVCAGPADLAGRKWPAVTTEELCGPPGKY